MSSMFGLWGNNVNREKLQIVKIDMSFRGSSCDLFFFPLNSKVYLILLAGLMKTFKN